MNCKWTALELVSNSVKKERHEPILCSPRDDQAEYNRPCLSAYMSDYMGGTTYDVAGVKTYRPEQRVAV